MTLKLNTDDIKNCNLLCDLNLNYRKSLPSFTVLNNQMTVKFKKNSFHKAYDVTFRKKEYILQNMRIHEIAHSVPENTADYQCTLNHFNSKNTNDRLLICIFLKVSDNFSNSQDFFRQLVSAHSENIAVDSDFSIQSIIPEKKSFYLYKFKSHLHAPAEDMYNFTTIVLDKLVHVGNDINYFMNYKFMIREEILDNTVPIYYNKDDNFVKNDDSTIKNIHRQQDSKVIHPYDSEEELDVNNHEDELSDDSNTEKLISRSLLSFIGLVFVLSFFKIGEKYNYSGKYIFIGLFLKFIGTLIWAIPHYIFIWGSKFIVVFALMFIYYIFLFSCKIWSHFKRSKSDGSNYNCSMENFTLSTMKTVIDTNIYNENNRILLFFVYVISIFLLVEYFLNIFGLPVKLKNSNYDILQDETYIYNDNICRNKMRLIGKKIHMEKCNRPTDLTKYISNESKRKKFAKNYEKFRKRGYPAYSALKGAMKSLDSSFELEFNYNIKGDKFHFCSIFNSLFAKSYNKECQEKNL